MGEAEGGQIVQHMSAVRGESQRTMTIIPAGDPHQSPEPRTLKTDAGDLDLVPATLEELDGLYRYWPMGMTASRRSEMAWCSSVVRRN